jgi:hypothetical protein
MFAKLSGPEWTITALPSASRRSPSEKRSVAVASVALPFALTSRLGRSPAWALWVAPEGLKCPPAVANVGASQRPVVHVEPVEAGCQSMDASDEEDDTAAALAARSSA